MSENKRIVEGNDESSIVTQQQENEIVEEINEDYVVHDGILIIKMDDDNDNDEHDHKSNHLEKNSINNDYNTCMMKMILSTMTILKIILSTKKMLKILKIMKII